MASASGKGDPAPIANRRARFRFHLLDRFVAGIALTGSEVQALRRRNANLGEAYARVENGELFLHNLHIGPYAPSGPYGHEAKRVRKLLLRRNEIRRIEGRFSEKGLTIVPVSLFFRAGRVKVDLALARGKREYDRREDIKEREAEREIRESTKP